MKKYFLIITTMLVALTISTYAGNNIFVANTPKVNNNYLADLQNKFKKGVNDVYLAFSIFDQKPVKKNIAVVYPTLVPRRNNMSANLNFVTGRPTIIPTITKTAIKPIIARINPTAVPTNLFKFISKGVSAYETGNKLIFKIEKGASYKVRNIEVNGKQYEVIDLSSK